MASSTSASVSYTHLSTGLVIDDLSFFAEGGGTLAAKGRVAKDGALAVHGRMADFPIDSVLAAAGQDGRGLCSTGFDVGGTLDAPEFSGMVQLTQAEFMSQKLNEAHGIDVYKRQVGDAATSEGCQR